jgi:hypothetical protein
MLTETIFIFSKHETMLIEIISIKYRQRLLLMIQNVSIYPQWIKQIDIKPDFYLIFIAELPLRLLKLFCCKNQAEIRFLSCSLFPIRYSLYAEFSGVAGASYD